jgi:hypothetical protein
MRRPRHALVARRSVLIRWCVDLRHDQRQRSFGAAHDRSGSFSLLDARGVTVSVAGTGLSTVADNRGQFTLTNVPTGTVQLNFTGPGANATVTLSGVGVGASAKVAATKDTTYDHTSCADATKNGASPPSPAPQPR